MVKGTASQPPPQVNAALIRQVHRPILISSQAPKHMTAM